MPLNELDRVRISRAAETGARRAERADKADHNRDRRRPVQCPRCRERLITFDTSRSEYHCDVCALTWRVTR